MCAVRVRDGEVRGNRALVTCSETESGSPVFSSKTGESFTGVTAVTVVVAESDQDRVLLLSYTRKVMVRAASVGASD